MKNILIAGYPRSGNTWTNSLFSFYFNAPYYDGYTEEQRLSGKKIVNEYNDNGLLGEHNRLDQEKLICSVVQTHELKQNLNRKHPKLLKKLEYNSSDYLVMIVREPKDVAISYFYHTYFFRPRLRQSLLPSLPIVLRDWFYHRFYFEKFVLKVAQEWTAFYQSWLQYNPFIIQYESLLEDPIEQIRLFTEGFNFTFYPKYAKEAKEFCSFSNLGKRENRHLKVKKTVPKNEKFIRSGKAGDWKEYFTENLQKDFDSITNELIKQL